MQTDPTHNRFLEVIFNIRGQLEKLEHLLLAYPNPNPNPATTGQPFYPPGYDPEEALAAELEAGPAGDAVDHLVESLDAARRATPFVAPSNQPRPTANPHAAPRPPKKPNTFANRQTNIRAAKVAPPVARPPTAPQPPAGLKSPFAPAVANTFLLDGGAIPDAAPVDLHRTQGAPIVKH